MLDAGLTGAGAFIGGVDPASSHGRPASDGLQREIAVCAATAGTSRIIILGAEGLCEEDAHRIMSEIAAGQHLVGGSGASHYQDRKFALVWPSPSPDHFFFRFYQLDQASGAFLPNMECGNAAAACGAFALAAGLCGHAADGMLAENLGTGQRSRLVATDPSPGAACDWEISFLQEDFSADSIQVAEGRVELGALPPIEFRTIERGNAFVFANLEPDWAGAELAEIVEQSARFAAGRAGDESYHPKILFYAIDSNGPDGATWLRASCHYAGEQHRSIPGSAAMTMAGLLTLTTPDSAPAPWTGGVRSFMIQHPSGLLAVEAAWVCEGGTTRIHATRFHSPVRILFVGHIFARVTS